MRRVLPVAALALLTLAARGAGAQRTPSGTGGGACARTPQEAEQQLARLEDEWNRAGTARDAAFFERLLADDFVATGGRTVVPRAAYIAGIRDTSDGVRTRAALSETRVRVYGDVAIVSGLASYAGTPSVRRRYTEVFACRQGRWRAVHGHYNTLRDPTSR
jgi:ketosteroid isomerase-like protein